MHSLSLPHFSPSRHKGMTAFAIVILLLLAVFAFLFFSGPGVLARVIMGSGSDATGRHVEIARPLEIHWNWTQPRIVARDVTISNWDQSKDAQMVKIDTVDVTIRIWKLLYGRTEIPRLVLQSPEIILEQDKDGNANWDFAPLSKSEGVKDAALPDDRHDFPVVEYIKIDDGRLVYRDAKKGLDADLRLKAAKGRSGEDENDFMTVTGSGTLQGRAFEVKASGGSFELLRDSASDFPLDLAVKMGNTSVTVKGTFKDPVTMRGIDARLELAGSNMADLFYLTGIPLPPTPPYKIEGQLGKDESVWSFKDFTGKVGGSDLSGDVTYDTGGKRGMLKGTLSSQRMDIKDLGGFIGYAPPADEPDAKLNDTQKKQRSAQRQSARVLPDVPINLDRLRAADMDVTLKAQKLVAPNLPFNAMNIRFALDNGLLTLDPMSLSLAKGTARGKLVLDGRKEMPHVDANIDLDKLQLASFFDGTRFEKETSGVIGGHIDLSGNGKSLAKVMGNGDGRMVALMSGGKISLLLIEAADLDLAQATPLLLGKDNKTHIRCAVTDFAITKGLLQSKVFVLDTHDTQLKGDVEINLRNERIDAVLNAHPKDASPLSLQSPITVKGSLKHPSVSIEPVATGLRAAGAVALGAILTPFAAILPFIETGDGEDSDCQALIGSAKSE